MSCPPDNPDVCYLRWPAPLYSQERHNPLAYRCHPSLFAQKVWPLFLWLTYPSYLHPLTTLLHPIYMLLTLSFGNRRMILTVGDVSTVMSLLF
jgi:hypothetical protein